MPRPAARPEGASSTGLPPTRNSPHGGRGPGTENQNRVENLDHLTEDNRQICFEQGKPCIYQDEHDPDQIITEWPNGVIDTKKLQTGTTVRRWPDGETEALTGEATFPHWPHP